MIKKILVTIVASLISFTCCMDGSSVVTKQLYIFSNAKTKMTISEDLLYLLEVYVVPPEEVTTIQFEGDLKAIQSILEKLHLQKETADTEPNKNLLITQINGIAQTYMSKDPEYLIELFNLALGIGLSARILSGIARAAAKQLNNDESLKQLFKGLDAMTQAIMQQHVIMQYPNFDCSVSGGAVFTCSVPDLGTPLSLSIQTYLDNGIPLDERITSTTQGKEVMLYSLSLTSVYGLENLVDPAEIFKLSLQDNELTEVHLLNLPALQRVDLQNNKQVEVQLQNLPALQIVGLENNKLTEVQLKDLLALEEIYLFDNKLTEILLQNLPALQYVWLQKNELTKVKLQNLSALKQVWLGKNQLTEVQLQNLPALQEVYLDDNKLTEVQLQNLPNLKKVKLQDNQLTEVRLQDLPSLQRVKLQNNKLTEVQLQNLPTLEEVRLENNQLTKLPHVAPTVRIYADGNPLSSANE